MKSSLARQDGVARYNSRWIDTGRKGELPASDVEVTKLRANLAIMLIDLRNIWLGMY